MSEIIRGLTEDTRPEDFVALGKQFWNDTESYGVSLATEQIASTVGAHMERYDRTRLQNLMREYPFHNLDRPRVKGVLIDSPETRLAEQAITVTRQDSIDHVQISIVDPNWLEYFPVNIEPRTYTSYHRAWGGFVPLSVRRPHVEGGLHPRNGSLHLGARPSLTISYTVDKDGNVGQSNETETIDRTVFLPMKAYDHYSARGGREDDRSLFTRNGTMLRQVHEAGNRLRPRDANVDSAGNTLVQMSGVVIGEWAQANNIPLIYKNQTGRSRPSEYSTEPGENISMQGLTNAPLSAPMRKFVDYFNYRMVAGTLNGDNALNQLTQNDMEGLAYMANSGNFPLDAEINPLIAWEAYIAHEFLTTGNVSPRRIHILLSEVPEGVDTLPIRYMLYNYLHRSPDTHDILMSIEGVTIHEQTERANECVLVVSKGVRQYRCIGDNPRDAAFAVLVEMMAEKPGITGTMKNLVESMI